MVVWIQDETVVYPAESTGEMPLPFEYAGEPTESAAIVPVSITNFGSASIGSQDDLWRLTFKSHDNQGKINLLGEPVPSDGVVINVSKTPGSDTVSLDIGILESGDQIDLKLLVIDAENPSWPEIDITTSLTGLPQPFVTGQSLRGRLTEKFAVPALFVMVILNSYVAYTTLKEKWGTLLQEPIILPSPFRVAWAISGRIVYVVIMSLILAVIIATALGWLASLTFLF